jgi:hypothetical protein
MIILRSGFPGEGKTLGVLRVLEGLALRCETSLRVADVSARIGDADVVEVAVQEAEACSIAAFEVASYYAC